MKRIHLLIIAVGVRSKLLFLFVLFITQNIFSLTYNVTVPTGTKACYFAGEIIGWSHQAMTKVDETHYTISFANANPTQPYKYCSGPDWGYEELDAAGVKPIECVGQEFDPDFHNAVMQVENDELESGTVAQELQKGYMYKDSVVRHSMVSVVQ